MRKIIMRGPEGTCSANIMGHEYEVDEDEGTVEVSNPEHVDILKRHGFVIDGEEQAAEPDEDGEPPASDDDDDDDEQPKEKKRKKRKKNRG